MMTFRLAGIGELLWDLLPSGKQLGGAPANFVYHVKAMGAHGVMVSRIGDDDLGIKMLQKLLTLSFDCQHIDIDRKHATGTAAVSINDHGQPYYAIREKVAWDHIPMTIGLRQLAEQVDAVTFGSLGQRSPVSRKTIRAFISRTPADALRIFDVNLRPPFCSHDIAEKSLKICNVLKLNEEELAKLTQWFKLDGDEVEILNELICRFSLRLIALTKGSKGSVLYSADQVSVHKGFRTNVVDTVGAGDAFTAALAMGLLQQWDLDTINEHANKVAAFVCSRPGATPELPEEFKIQSVPTIHK